MKIKSVPVTRVKAGPDDGLKEGEFIVYPSTFTRQPDAYGDVVAKGAFLDDIEAWAKSGQVLPGLYGHRMDDPDYFVAGALKEGEDDHGWWVHGVFDLENPKAQQVYRLVKGRRLNQLSFAYDVLEEGKVDLGDGKTANELRKLKRYEFSFVPVGANQDTSVVAVKGIIDHIKNSPGLSKDSRTALLDARDSIDSVLASLEDGEAAPAANDQEQQASGNDDPAKTEASGEDPEKGKPSVEVEEPKSGPPVSRLAAQTHIYALMGAERGSQS